METMVSDDRFWQGRRVLVTGHTGFKGAWLSLWLQKLGALVSGYALAPPTDPSLFAAARVSEGMRPTTGDVTDLPFLTNAVGEARPDIVFHLAAQSLVRYGYANPVETYATNVMGTVNLLEACRSAPSIRAVVVITSDKCYENREWVWGYREDDPLGGHDPYSSSKGCAELVAAAYRRSYVPAGTPLGIATARAGNVIGGGDWAADRLLPDLLRAFAAGESALIRNPGAIRPWQHVLEPLRGYLLLARRLCASPPARFAGAWNFGPEDADARPVAWVADRLAGLWGGGASWHSDEAAHPHEAATLKLDCSKAHALLGWQPVLRLDRALELIVAWQRAYRDGRDMRAFSLAQIDQYESLGPGQP